MSEVREYQVFVSTRDEGDPISIGSEAIATAIADAFDGEHLEGVGVKDVKNPVDSVRIENGAVVAGAFDEV